MRAIIISEPKSGTYLCSALLKNLGMHQTYWHLFYQWYTAYDGDKIVEGRYKPNNFRVEKTMEEMVPQIPQNGFAVTHLPKTTRMMKCFKGFKKVIVTRPFEEKKASNDVWRKTTNRAPSSYDIEHHLWLEEEDKFHIEFKDMIEINVEKIDALQVYLFGSIITDSKEAMAAALNEETITKSDKRRKGD